MNSRNSSANATVLAGLKILLAVGILSAFSHSNATTFAFSGMAAKYPIASSSAFALISVWFIRSLLTGSMLLLPPGILLPGEGSFK